MGQLLPVGAYHATKVEQAESANRYPRPYRTSAIGGRQVRRCVLADHVSSQDRFQCESYTPTGNGPPAGLSTCSRPSPPRDVGGSRVRGRQNRLLFGPLASMYRRDEGVDELDNVGDFADQDDLPDDPFVRDYYEGDP